MKQINSHEAILKIYVLKNITKEKALSEIASLIDKSFLITENMSQMHRKNSYKGYVFNNMFPLEEIYKAGTIASIQIRTIDQVLLNHIRDVLKDTTTDKIKSLAVMTKEINLKDDWIKNIYSITPVIIKTENGYWRGNLSINEYLQRIKVNLIKKYNQIYNTKINEDFELFKGVEFTNLKPIGCEYKNIVLLGDKLELEIAENEKAQKLANLALGAGIGEMNARGYGFVNYNLY